MNGEIQYIADTLLINKVTKLNQVLSSDFKKEAGVLEDLAGSVKSYVNSNLDTSSPGAITKSVIDFLSPAIFFRINPLFGVLYTIAQSMFGFSLSSILTSITSKIIPKITAGEQINPDDINQAGAGLVSSASTDFFNDLRDLEKENKLTKLAQQPLGGAFIPDKNTPLLYKIFGFLGQSKGKNLMVGFIVWLIKTILLSAGLLAVGSGTAKILGIDDKKEAPSFPGQTIPTQYTPSAKAPATPLVGLTPSGAGQEYYANDMNSMWVVPLDGMSPKDALISWTEEIYPQLRGYEDIILENPSFQRTLQLISKNYKNGKDLIIPPGFSRRIDIINQFAGNVFNDVKGLENV